jgi:AcrR family transcriptional regulator
MPRGIPNDAESEEAMKELIVEAAMQCFAQRGIEKTSLNDVAHVAGFSRGTVYRYFNDRPALIHEVVEFGSRQYFSDAAKAMKNKPTLAKQVGAFGEVAARTAVRTHSPTRLLTGDMELMRLIVADSEETLRRTVLFLEPYVRAAKARGEISKTVRTSEASEWLGRIIMSITSAPISLHFNVENPKSVSRFVERFATVGLQPSRTSGKP